MKAKKYLSLILASAMVMTALPAAAMAENAAESEETAEEAPDEGLSEEQIAELLDELMGEAAEDEDTEDEDDSEKYDQIETISEGDPKITRKLFPGYLNNISNTFDIQLYFINDVMDFPYIEINDMGDLLYAVYHYLRKDDGYKLKIEKNGPVVELGRENGYTLEINFDQGTLHFDDYDAFIHNSTETFLLESVSTYETDEEGNELLLNRSEKGSYDRYGKAVDICLADYNIPLYRTEGDEHYLVPLQTMGDFLLAVPCLVDTAFNNNSLFVVNSDAIKYNGMITDLGMKFAGGPSDELSKELAEYSYNELCLVLDCFYGLKDTHGITSFDELFREIGFKDKLSSVNSNVVDGALNDFITYYLDDLHSGINLNSYRSDNPETLDGQGLSLKKIIADNDKFSDARSKAPRQVNSYEEVGNTAYVTFDSFNFMNSASGYYNDEYILQTDPADPQIDTVGLILYAHKQITRENSPIENVVLDLSINGGGEIDAAAVVAAWFLGEAGISTQSTFTGARSTSLYQADINLDGKYDEKDSVADKNLYCLVSPISFSCGNLVPAIFKYSHNVTIIGQTSGGGSCSVLGLNTAYGTFYQISSPDNLSYVHNGSYYRIDSGVEPDYFINKPANFYDRDALTDYINGLF